jgi:hypothetical protein
MSTADDARPGAVESTGPVGMFRDPTARNYLFVGLAALLIVAAVLFMRGGLAAALLPTLVAAFGLLARRTAMPGVFLVLVCYFAVFPFGIPDLVHPFSDIPASHFRLMDLILVGAVLAYLAAQFRLLGLTFQGMPPDAPPGPRKKGDKPPRRPGSLVPPEEVGRMFAAVGACVLIGQIVWILISELRPEFRAFPPFRAAEPAASRSHYNDAEPLYRFLMLAFLLAVATVPAGLAFWYWRLTRLGPAESRMVLLDAGWREARRELNRQEKWRAWGLARRRPKPKKPRPEPEERPKPTGPRRSFAEALALTCGMVALGGVVAFVVAIVLVRWLGR